MPVKPRLLIAILCGVGCLIGLSACTTQPSSKEVSLWACPLAKAASRTRAAHVRAINAGNETHSTEIPKCYWSDGIKNLHPIRVYTHRVNIVVVQKLSDKVEEGKYIYVPESSYLPMSGDDGFTFSPNPLNGNTYNSGNGVFEFKRRTEN